MVSYHHLPFNRVSNYREPGKVNVNTIPSDQALGNPPSEIGQASSIWQGVLNTPIANAAPVWTSVFASRQGGSTPNLLPSRFANPFRSAAGASLSLPGMPTTVNHYQMEVDATLMRAFNTASPDVECCQ